MLVDAATTWGRAVSVRVRPCNTLHDFRGLAGCIKTYGILTCLAVADRARPVAGLWGSSSAYLIGSVVASDEAFDAAAQEKLNKECHDFRARPSYPAG